MDFEQVMDLDYETQHLGFHPRTYLDRVYNVFYESIHEALNELKNYLCSEYSHIIPVSSIHPRTDELFNKLIKQLDKAMDKLEIYMDNVIFSIPDYVTLPEDEVHLPNPATKEDEEKLDKEIEQLKQRIIEERIRKRFLKEKMDEQKYVSRVLYAFKSKLTKIKDIASEVKETQDDLVLSLEKCWEIWNTVKQPPCNEIYESQF